MKFLELIEAMLQDPAFRSAIGSAVGGFIAVILYFLIRLKIAKSRAVPSIIRRYLVANYLNRGVKPEMAGEIQHNRGKVVSVAEAHKHNVDHELWEYSDDFVNNIETSNVFYGPYCTDFSEPGLYSVSFRILALGLPTPTDTELGVDYLLLELDVNQKLTDYAVIPKPVDPNVRVNPPQPVESVLVGYKKDYQVCRKYVRVSDVATKGWVDLTLVFNASPVGEWEFRAFVFNGKDGRPDNISKCASSFRLLFDMVTLTKINKLKIPDL